MFVVMFFAFRGACVTNGGTDTAELCTKFRISAHECRTGPAEVRAIDTEAGAFRHIAQALICATLAFLGTAHTSIYTGLMLMSHGENLHPWVLHTYFSAA